MIAVVTTNQTADPDFTLDEEPGTQIEIVGWVVRGHNLNAVYRDDDGAVHEIHAWAIRLLPHVEAVEA